jgi:hypothetical protein
MQNPLSKTQAFGLKFPATYFAIEFNKQYSYSTPQLHSFELYVWPCFFVVWLHRETNAAYSSVRSNIIQSKPFSYNFRLY